VHLPVSRIVIAEAVHDQVEVVAEALDLRRRRVGEGVLDEQRVELEDVLEDALGLAVLAVEVATR